MKILTIHADFIEFQAKKKAFKGAEEGVDENKHRIEECLVIFTAVEKRDEFNTKIVLQKYLKNIEDIAAQVNATSLVLYPYAHLSSQLSSPQIAESLMKDAEKQLKIKYKVSRAPFGWYKSFNISCKGHPLSELSREFSVEDAEKEIFRTTSEKPTLIPPTSNLKREGKDELFTFNTNKLSSEEKIKLSAGLVLAKVISELYPQSQLGQINLHHDQAYVEFSNLKIKQEELPRLEKQMQKVILQTLKIEKSTKQLTHLQQEIAQDLGRDAITYILSNITATSLFRDPFVKLTKEIVAFKLLNISSAYWKNNSLNEQLTRINLVAFASPEELNLYLKKIADAEARSHLKIGKEQNIFVISELVGQGLPLLAPKGAIIRNEIIDYLWQLHKEKGYQQVWTPHIAKDILYKTSGHWDKFGDDLFKVKGKSDDFILKPMNCPHHMQIFDSFAFSYRDLPVRYFEPATVYRDEKSGQLIGLSRVRSITQDDGHLFCRISQIKQEVKTIVNVIHEFYHTLGLDKDYWVSFSVRGDDNTKYLGTDHIWNIAETALEEAAKENKLPYKKITGEAAFYGPKLDFVFQDALGREWQLATIQCDFNLPERFNLSFMNEKSEKERPVVIHRTISGSLERFLSILIEHYSGKFPLWLSPVQVIIVTVTDRNIPFAEEVVKELRKNNLRVKLNADSETIGKKVRDAQLERANYIITIGDKECEHKTVAIRTRNGEIKFDVPLNSFIASLRKEIIEKRHT
ncbi:threonine--tRNA ligase [Candidatus Woesearchaeota archaeon]|nr:threonine--tRNA ligase [Candidatus Woesearchaeota archaeon]